MKQLILFLLCLSTWTAQAKIYNVKDYGAKADGTTTIDNVKYILRGYDDICGKLTKVGAKIELI